MEYDVSCPHCSQKLTLSDEDMGNVVLCPNCNEELCFAVEDIESAKKMRQETSRRLKMEKRSKTRFKFIIAKFNEVENILNSLFLQEGWYVVSQSTVFLGETAVAFDSFGAGKRTEALALVLRKDD